MYGGGGGEEICLVKITVQYDDKTKTGNLRFTFELFCELREFYIFSILLCFGLLVFMIECSRRRYQYQF
jgi:hypothetical protein